MTTVVCNISDILGNPIDNGVVSINVEALRATDGRLILPRRVEQELVGGETTFTNVAPGNTQFHIRWGRSSDVNIRATVPDQEIVTLSEIVETIQVYEPPVVGVVHIAKTQAQEAAGRAEAGAEAAWAWARGSLITESPPGSGLYVQHPELFRESPEESGLYEIIP